MDLLGADFFDAPYSKPPELWVDDYQALPVSKGNRRAMHTALGMLAISVVAIGGFLVYHKLIMPTPVALGTGGAYEMPVPIMDAPQPPVKLPAPQEAARLRVHEPTAMMRVPSEAGSAAVVAATDAPASNLETRPPPQPDNLDDGDDGYEELLADGTKLAGKGRNREALGVLERARALRPSGGRVLAELALLHLNRRDNEQAGVLATRAVAVDPSLSKAWIVLGATRDAVRDRAGARTAYARCASLPMDAYVRECRLLAR